MNRLLFVCMGNICRSPTAEGVMRQRLQEHGLDRRVEVDSAGLESYHVGDAPDRRAQAAARRRGYDLSGLRARQVDAGVFSRVAPRVPVGSVRVGGSGVRNAQDLLAYAANGADAVLVGEALVTQDDPAAAVQELVSAGEHPAVRHAD